MRLIKIEANKYIVNDVNESDSNYKELVNSIINIASQENCKMIIIGAKIGTYILDDFRYVVAPLSVASEYDLTHKLYIYGTLDNKVTIWIDPYLTWNDWTITFINNIEEYEKCEKYGVGFCNI